MWRNLSSCVLLEQLQPCSRAFFRCKWVLRNKTKFPNSESSPIIFTAIKKNYIPCKTSKTM